MARPRICDKAMRLCGFVPPEPPSALRPSSGSLYLKSGDLGSSSSFAIQAVWPWAKSLKSLHQLISLQLFPLLQREADKTYLMEFLYKTTVRQTKRTKILTYVLVPEVFQQGSKVRKMVQQSKIRDGNLFQWFRNSTLLNHPPMKNIPIEFQK